MEEFERCALTGEVLVKKMSAFAGRHQPQEKSGGELRVPAGAATARVFAKAAQGRRRRRKGRRIIGCGGAAEAPERREGVPQE